MRNVMKRAVWMAALGAAFAGGFVAHSVMPGETTAYAQAGRVFELRTYTAGEGKLDALHARFRDHTLRIFKKHGMTNMFYWKPMDAPASQTTLVYLLGHESREAAKKSWDAFRNDAEWKKIASESEVNGRLATKVESVFLEAADYSPMK